MLVPSPNSPEPQVELLQAIDSQRALEIATAHIRDPHYESTIAWYYVGRQTKFDFEAIREACQAEKVDLSLSHIRKGDNLITQFFDFEYYSLRVLNPQTIPAQISAGRTQMPLGSIQVYNAGNIQYAGILLDSHEAQVWPEFIPELQKLGFTCWEANRDPYANTYNGPFRNVHTLEECLGPAAHEIVEAFRSGEAECVIINRN